MKKIWFKISDSMISCKPLKDLNIVFLGADTVLCFTYGIQRKAENVKFVTKELCDEAWNHIKETLIPSQLVHIPPDDRCKCSIPDINPHPKGGSYCGFCGGSLPTDLFSARG